MVIKQYKVEKGIATPVNHLETATEGDFYRRKSEGVNWGDFLHEQWHKFEDEKAAHTYATNAQDGVYDADCFKLKWQCYDHDREQWQDPEQSAECTWEKFNEWFRTTRKHLQLIDNPIPKMETTELPLPEIGVKKAEVEEMNHARFEATLRRNGIFEYDVRLYPEIQEYINIQPANNDYAVKVLKSEIEQLESSKQIKLSDYECYSVNYCINKLNHIIDLLTPNN